MVDANSIKQSMLTHGFWAAVCRKCGTTVGGQLAEYGKPDRAFYCVDCSKSGGSVVELLLDEFQEIGGALVIRRPKPELIQMPPEFKKLQ